MKRSKRRLFVFLPKKTVIRRRHCLIGQSCCSMAWKKVLRQEVFAPKRSLNQPKAMCICIRSITKSNRSIYVCLLFLFCLDIFISRSYENHSKTSPVQQLITWAPTVMKNGRAQRGCPITTYKDTLLKDTGLENVRNLESYSHIVPYGVSLLFNVF